jgi:hypothetical protein
MCVKQELQPLLFNTETRNYHSLASFHWDPVPLNQYFHWKYEHIDLNSNQKRLQIGLWITDKAFDLWWNRLPFFVLLNKCI